MQKHHQRNRLFWTELHITHCYEALTLDTYISLKPSRNIWSKIHSRRSKNPKHWTLGMQNVYTIKCVNVCYGRVHTFPIEHCRNWENENISFTISYPLVLSCPVLYTVYNNNCVHCMYSWIYHDDVYVETLNKCFCYSHSPSFGDGKQKNQQIKSILRNIFIFTLLLYCLPIWYVVR